MNRAEQAEPPGASGCVRRRVDVASAPTYSGYNDVVHPQVGSRIDRWASLVFRVSPTYFDQQSVAEVNAVRCPFCRYADSRVIDSREVEEGQAIRRRRSCADCGRRFTTVEEVALAVVKRSGVTEPFSRDKVVRGVARACQGRPVDEDALQQLAHRVEETIRSSGSAEVPSHEVGLAILGPLRELDEVAYLRFASVYRSFSSAEDFEKEIRELRHAQESRQVDPA